MKRIILTEKISLQNLLNLLDFPENLQKDAKDLLAFQCSAFCNDTRELQTDDIFFALDGVNHRGKDFIAKATALNAKAVLVEDTHYNLSKQQNSAIVSIPNLNKRIGDFLAKILQINTEDFDIYAVTGTNGKTSVAHFLVQAWTNLNISAKFIGTIGVGDLDNLQPSDNTTPDIFILYNLLYKWKNAGVKKVVMEASSHALVQNRLAGLKLKTAIFTNLTQDHLDYHQNMQNYGKAKSLLFSDYSAKNAVFNLDDDFGKQLFARFKSNLNAFSYSSSDKNANLYLLEKNLSLNGLNAKINYLQQTYNLFVPIIGEFNFANIAAVLSCLLIDGVNIEVALNALTKIKSVLGRMQLVNDKYLPKVIVDYAHTPDALEKALKSVKAHCRGNLICVFGAGGDRDNGKRPLMAKTAAAIADKIYITDDNPRTENAENIRKQIIAGFSTKDNFSQIGDRKQAIQTAIKNAKAEDWILIAGKGHEDYQIIGTHKQHFSDVEVALQCLTENKDN